MSAINDHGTTGFFSSMVSDNKQKAGLKSGFLNVLVIVICLNIGCQNTHTWAAGAFTILWTQAGSQVPAALAWKQAAEV